MKARGVFLLGPSLQDDSVRLTSTVPVRYTRMQIKKKEEECRAYDARLQSGRCKWKGVI